jgi:Ca2+-binding EF-hand superfamily protein
MGCCCCCSYEPPLHPGCDPQSGKILRELKLSNSEINKLCESFAYVDLDSSGTIRSDEFFGFFRVEGTPLTKRIFHVMDVDGSGKLNFVEFALVCVTVLLCCCASSD